MDVPAGVTQEEGLTGFLHLPSAVLAFIFLARRIQSFLSTVDREIEFCVLTNQSFSTCWVFYFLFLFFCEIGHFSFSFSCFCEECWRSQNESTIIL